MMAISLVTMERVDVLANLSAIVAVQKAIFLVIMAMAIFLAAMVRATSLVSEEMVIF